MTKDELIEKYRDINDDWWYECVYDWFDEQCKERGIEISTTTRTYSRNATAKAREEKDITWSGFWSQGDGAAFAGRVEDFKLALGDSYSDYPIFQKYVEDLGGYCRMSWGTTNSNCVTLRDIEIEDMGAYLDDDHPFAELWQEQLNKEAESVDELIGDVVDDLCSLLYKALEDEYDSLTSDESVWECIVSNELDKELDEELDEELDKEVA